MRRGCGGVDFGASCPSTRLGCDLLREHPSRVRISSRGPHSAGHRRAPHHRGLRDAEGRALAGRDGACAASSSRSLREQIKNRPSRPCRLRPCRLRPCKPRPCKPRCKPRPCKPRPCRLRPYRSTRPGCVREARAEGGGRAGALGARSPHRGVQALSGSERSGGQGSTGAARSHAQPVGRAWRARRGADLALREHGPMLGLAR